MLGSISGEIPGRKIGQETTRVSDQFLQMVSLWLSQ